MYFLRGSRVWLRPLLPSDVGERYLRWLNDPEVNRHSQRRFFPTGEHALRKFVEEADRGDRMVLAITLDRGARHVGNVMLSDIHPIHRYADVSILIGERDVWGQGFGAEAIYLVSRHAFETLGLHRLEAGTVNPAFVRMVTAKLGWTEEGRLRRRFLLDGEYVDYIRLGILREEFHRIPAYEEGRGD